MALTNLPACVNWMTTVGGGTVESGAGGWGAKAGSKPGTSQEQARNYRSVVVLSW